MSSHRLHPRAVATVLVALCLAAFAAPAAFASDQSGDTIAGYRFAAPDRAMQSPGGSVVGLRIVRDAHATLNLQPAATLDGAGASHDAGDNLAAALVAVAVVLVLVAPFAVTARWRGAQPA